MAWEMNLHLVSLMCRNRPRLRLWKRGRFYDPYNREDEVPGVGDGEETFYQKLDYTSIPYEGTGTEEDPYVFLCSSAKGR